MNYPFADINLIRTSVNNLLDEIANYSKSKIDEKMK